MSDAMTIVLEWKTVERLVRADMEAKGYAVNDVTANVRFTAKPGPLAETSSAFEDLFGKSVCAPPPRRVKPVVSVQGITVKVVVEEK